MNENDMLRHVLSYPGLFDAIFDGLTQTAQTAVPDTVLDQIDSVYIYGSGDSLNAANCVIQAFREYAHVSACAVPALEASRYLAAFTLPEQAARTLTICVSSSGEAPRSAEAAMNLRKAGFLTMAVTAHPDSCVGHAVEYIFTAQAPAFSAAPIPLPGIRSFVPPVIGLYLLAVRLGLRRGILTQKQGQAVCAELAGLADILRVAMKTGAEVMSRFAALCGRCERMEFLAAGPSRGAADFGVSKVLEAQGYSVLSQDLEEFAHQTFFSNDTGQLPTVLLIPSRGRSRQRAMEILLIVQRLERPVLVMTDDPAVLEGWTGIESLCLCKPVSEPLISLVFACLMAYLSAVMPLREGDVYMHGHQGVYCEDGLPTIRGSALAID